MSFAGMNAGYYEDAFMSKDEIEIIMNPTRQIDTVAGIEMYCINIGCEYTFDIATHKNGFEVLLLRRGVPRRMALCTHENDAQTILDALRYAKNAG